MRNVLTGSVVCLLALVAPAFGVHTYTFHPSPSDLNDLDHSKVYTWGVDWSAHKTETITSATLFINDLENWQPENDVLFIHLLDNPVLGTKEITDPTSYNQDYFSGQGILLTAYHDSSRPAHMPADWWTYTFTPSNLQTLKTYAADGRIGLGFDPDCHYYNCGVTWTINTSSAPEPATALLAGPAPGVHPPIPQSAVGGVTVAG